VEIDGIENVDLATIIESVSVSLFLSMIDGSCGSFSSSP
jgi:hypothetical protein